MELTKYAQAIKAELEMELTKRGSTLAEFEQSLQTLHTGEGVFKVASFGGSVIKESQEKQAEGGSLYNFAKAIPEAALKGSMAGGALAGLTFDEMDKSVDSLNKSLEREREKVNLVRRITQNLKREHGFI